MFKLFASLTISELGSFLVSRITGSIPLSTINAKIDYGFAEAWTAQGHIGVQVWINQGTYLGESSDGNDAETDQAPKSAKRSHKR